MIASILTPFTVLKTRPPSQHISERVPRSALFAPHIFINGTNATQDWDDCPWVNGSGTYNDPYVLHDLTISGLANGSCIYVTNTREYFRIENCYVSGSEIWLGEYPVAGIRVSNSTNGIIVNNTCDGNSEYGIYLFSSSNISVVKNYCTWNHASGICSESGTNTTIAINNCTANSFGIWLKNSSNHTLVGNTCSKNTACGIAFYGITNNNVVRENICLVNWINIEVHNGYYYIIVENICNGGSGGIFFWGGENSTIDRNHCSGVSDGMSLSRLSNCIISENTCSMNYIGFCASQVNNSIIRGNNCSENKQFGIYLKNSNYNLIFQNIAIGNGNQSFIEEDCVGNYIHDNLFLDKPLFWTWLVISIIAMGGSGVLVIIRLYRQRKLMKTRGCFPPGGFKKGPVAPWSSQRGAKLCRIGN